MKTEDLLKLGFTRNEAKIYFILIEHNQLQAGEISKKTLINRRTTYDTLQRLIEKGYITYNIIANKKAFRAINPEVILNQIKEKEKQAKEIVPKLKKIYSKNKENEETNIYQGRNGIRTILNEMLKVKAYVGFGSNEKFPEVMKHDFTIFQKKKKELGIKSRTLMSVSMKNKAILKEGFTQYKFLPQKYSLPTSTFVYGNKTATIIWSETPVAMVVENKEVAKSFEQYFNALWEISKK